MITQYDIMSNLFLTKKQANLFTKQIINSSTKIFCNRTAMWNGDGVYYKTKQIVLAEVATRKGFLFMTMIPGKRNPFDRIHLATAIKITDFDWYSHSEGDNPYFQISINGLVLTGTGDALHANIQDSAEYGNYEKVNELMILYTPGSLHWVESHAFHFMEEDIFFYHPTNTHPVATEDVEEINRFFLRKFHSDREPQKQPKHLKINTSNVCPDMDNNTVVMSGFLEHVKNFFTKKGEKMASARLRDDNGTIDLIIFSNVYDGYEETISKGSKIIATGKLDVSEGAAFLIPERFEYGVKS